MRDRVNEILSLRTGQPLTRMREDTDRV